MRQLLRSAGVSRRGAIGWIALWLLVLGPALPAVATPVTRIVVVGDSQAEGLAGALVRRLRGERQYRVIDKSRISTGLVSVASYNWPKVAEGIAKGEHADVAVVMFGANDRPPLRVDNPADAARSAAFSSIYGRRIREIIQVFRDAHARVIWVGHPIVRDPRFSADMAFLNHLYEEASKEAGIEFVPLWDLFADNGAYSAFGKGSDGMTHRMRADDGVHLTTAGYDLAVNRLLPLIIAPVEAAGAPAAQP